MRGCSSMVGCLPTVCNILNLIPRTIKEGRKGGGKQAKRMEGKSKGKEHIKTTVNKNLIKRDTGMSQQSNLASVCEIQRLVLSITK